MKNGVYLAKDGLPPAAYLARLPFRRSATSSIVLHTIPDWDSRRPTLVAFRMDIQLEQLWVFSEQYRVPGSNVTIDNAMISFTGRSIHITKIPIKPFSQVYKFFCMPYKDYGWEFHPSSNTFGGGSVDVESCLVKHTDTGMIVHHVVSSLHHRYRKLTFNLILHIFLRTHPLLAELCQMGMGTCGKWRKQFWEFLLELKVGKNVKLPYHVQSGAVNNEITTFPRMVSSPITIMSTIHPLHSEDSLVLRMRKHPGNKCTNASGVNSTFLPGQWQIELNTPVIVDAFNQERLGVYVVNQYRTYFHTQLMFRYNWYPILYWILETAIVNSLIIYRDLQAYKEHTVEYFVFWLCIVCDLLQAGSPPIIKSSSYIPASQKLTWPAPVIQSALPSLPTMLSTKHTPLPLCRKIAGMHSPLWLESRVDCFLCRWRRCQGGSGDGIKTSTKCEKCSEHQQDVNRSGSHIQTSQTLSSTTPVLLDSSRCSQVPLELSKRLSDSTRISSGAPESTGSYGGAFRILLVG